MKKLMMLFAIAALVFGGVACASDDPAVSPGAGDDTSEDISAEGSPGTTPADDTIDAQISIVDFGYEPDEFTATAGEPVTWQNTGDVDHTVTFDEGGIDSGNIGAGADFTHTFEDAGEFTYFCSLHGADQMSGTVTVE